MSICADRRKYRRIGSVLLVTNHVLRPQWSILDLGCGAGTVLGELQKYYADTSPAQVGFDPLLQGQIFVGVELVDALVDEMADEMKGKGIDLYQGIVHAHVVRLLILLHVFATLIFSSFLYIYFCPLDLMCTLSLTCRRCHRVFSPRAILRGYVRLYHTH